MMVSQPFYLALTGPGTTVDDNAAINAAVAVNTVLTNAIIATNTVATNAVMANPVAANAATTRTITTSTVTTSTVVANTAFFQCCCNQRRFGSKEDVYSLPDIPPGAICPLQSIFLDLL